MIPIKGLVVCVDYDDYLGITLPANMRHLIECVVVTSPTDERTRAVAASVPGARLFMTDAFTRGGRRFNKGAAIEEAFDALGRDGWILVWDADTILPQSLTLVPVMDPSRLYGAKRRLCGSDEVPPESKWRDWPVSREAGWPGYFQLFHGSALHDVRPWYGVVSDHAGIGDAYFQNHWPVEKKGWLPVEVLHLGPRDTNWHGRASPRLDGLPTPVSVEDVDRLFRESGWRK